jgi:cell division protein FtsB
VRGVIVALRRPRMSFGLGPQIVAILLVVGLAGAMAIQPTRQLLEQRRRIAEMTRDLRRTQRANAVLAATAARLRDPDHLEHLAREQMGLVRPGETTYMVMPPSRKAAARRRARPQRAPARDTDASYLERLFEFIGIRIE